KNSVIDDNNKCDIYYKIFCGTQNKKSQRNTSTDIGTIFNEKYYSNISPQKGTLGNIIKLFKSYFSRNINKIQNKQFFAWHPNYFDRIIRNENELNRIRKYILENPLKWKLEKNNPENIFM
ncbi:MAG: hypothetical protein Q9M94_01480, partial [Candidatus Gracilibacteria bacterium]|nr:hypothetical protein [Candidatus Gracilibacteria bacterium]